jgi:hypothetical protein
MDSIKSRQEQDDNSTSNKKNYFTTHSLTLVNQKSNTVLAKQNYQSDQNT